jgi:hypothetical protein
MLLHYHDRVTAAVTSEFVLDPAPATLPFEPRKRAAEARVTNATISVYSSISRPDSWRNKALRSFNPVISCT